MNEHVIVIADRDAAHCATHAAFFEAKGYVVHTCSDGLEALNLCVTMKPAVVLLELELPTLDGFETTRRIRADASLAGIRIVAVTELSDERSSARAWEAGFHEFLSKPVSASMLLAMARPTREMQGVVERL